jgi:hypothetical protein
MLTRVDVSGVSNSGNGDVAIDHDTLQSLYSDVVKKAESTVRWYQISRRRKKLPANFIRILSFVSFGLAGLLAAIQTMGQPQISAAFVFQGLNAGQIGFLTAGFGAGTLTFDKFFGLSSGWVRYMMTELGTQQIIDDFKLDWASAYCAAPKDANGKLVDGSSLFQSLKVFSAKIDSQIQEETRQWAAEFQQSMAFLQGLAKTTQSALQPGIISVAISRGADVDPQVSVSLDGQQWATGNGPIVVLPNVIAGAHQITVKGRKAGADVENSVATTVSGNAVAQVSVSLG